MTEDFIETIEGEFNPANLWKKPQYIEQAIQKEDYHYNFCNGVQIYSIAKHLGVQYDAVQDAIRGVKKLPSDQIRLWAAFVGISYRKLSRLLHFVGENRSRIVNECRKEKRRIPDKFKNR